MVAAKAAGLEAIDGPYGAYHDGDGLRTSALLARQLGCDGKWAIHPTQIEPLNDIFSPTEEELARARAIHERYERAIGSEGTGALGLDGDLVDAASLRLAGRVLARARSAGKSME